MKNTVNQLEKTRSENPEFIQVQASIYAAAEKLKITPAEYIDLASENLKITAAEFLNLMKVSAELQNQKNEI